MQLFETKLMLVSDTWGIKVKVPSTDVTVMLRAVFMSEQATHYGVIRMFVDHDYVIEEQKCLSYDARFVFDVVGIDWVNANKIQAIKLIRKFTSCSLLDAKNAVEEYSK